MKGSEYEVSRSYRRRWQVRYEQEQEGVVCYDASQAKLSLSSRPDPHQESPPPDHSSLP